MKWRAVGFVVGLVAVVGVFAVIAYWAHHDRYRHRVNLGCGGEGYTVKEVIDAAEKIAGKKIPTRISDRRPGDPAVLIASSDRIRSELGWKPEFQDLSMIIDSAWRWMQRSDAAAKTGS